MKDNLKKYKLDVLLDQIGNESRAMFINNEAMKIKYIQGTYKKCPIYQSIWDMIDISYLAICASNDYKSKVLKREDIVYIINQYRNYDEELSRIKMDQVDKKDTLLYILYGHSQAQFIYQSRHLVIGQMNRNIELLQHTYKKINSNVDIDLIVKEVIGFNSEEFNDLLFFVNLIGLLTNDITNIDIPNIFSKINPKITNENISKIVDLYSATYREYRESVFGKHHLKFKPIIKTDNKKVLISHQYLLYNLLAEGLYWIIRNCFHIKGTQDFTNVFGLYYEKYLEDICTYYLDPDKFRKLVEDSKSQICDWQIETSKYILLIEQKSALASIFTKNIHPDIKQIRSYLKKLGKGFNQLSISENKIKNPYKKTIVKLLVHYESLYMHLAKEMTF